MTCIAIGSYSAKGSIEPDFTHSALLIRDIDPHDPILNKAKEHGYHIWHGPASNFSSAVAINPSLLKASSYELIHEHGMEASLLKVESFVNMLLVSASNVGFNLERLIDKVNASKDTPLCVIALNWQEIPEQTEHRIALLGKAGFNVYGNHDRTTEYFFAIRYRKSYFERISSIALKTKDVQVKSRGHELELHQCMVQPVLFDNLLTNHPQEVQTIVLAVACVIGSGYLAFKT